MAGIHTRSRFYTFSGYLKFEDAQKNLKSLSCPQYFLHYTVSPWETFRRSRACNSEVNSHIWPEIELVQAVMFVLAMCKC